MLTKTVLNFKQKRYSFKFILFWTEIYFTNYLFKETEFVVVHLCINAGILKFITLVVQSNHAFMN